MIRVLSLLAALVLLAACPLIGGEIVFNFSAGDNGGFSAAQIGVINPWTFSGQDWRVNGTDNTNRTLLSPTLTATGGPVTVTIVHTVNFEELWDGGVLAMQINGFPITRITDFSQGGYNYSTLGASFPSGPNGPGWSSQASFTSIANAGDFTAGDSFVLRFEAAWDPFILNSGPNWRISSVTVSGVEDLGTAVPEPSSALLVVAGFGALWLARRRR